MGRVARIRQGDAEGFAEAFLSSGALSRQGSVTITGFFDSGVGGSGGTSYEFSAVVDGDGLVFTDVYLHEHGDGDEAEGLKGYMVGSFHQIGRAISRRNPLVAYSVPEDRDNQMSVFLKR